MLDSASQSHGIGALTLRDIIPVAPNMIKAIIPLFGLSKRQKHLKSEQPTK